MRAVTGGEATLRPDCPECGGPLSEPVSGSVHCYRKCARCGEEFELDDPRLA